MPIISNHKEMSQSAVLVLEEPLLRENPNRFVLYPIKDEDVSTKQCDLFQYESKPFSLITLQ